MCDAKSVVHKYSYKLLDFPFPYLWIVTLVSGVIDFQSLSLKEVQEQMVDDYCPQILKLLVYT